MSMLFQSFAVWPHMTVFDNVAYGLRVKRYAKPEVAGRDVGVRKLRRQRHGRQPVPGVHRPLLLLPVPRPAGDGNGLGRTDLGGGGQLHGRCQ